MAVNQTEYSRFELRLEIKFFVLFCYICFFLFNCISTSWVIYCQMHISRSIVVVYLIHCWGQIFCWLRSANHVKFTEKCVMWTKKLILGKKKFTNGLNMGWPLQIEQRSFMKYLLAEKSKPCEIYRRMYDLYREVHFYQKMFTNGLNMDLSLQAWIEKKNNPCSENTSTLWQWKSCWCFS